MIQENAKTFGRYNIHIIHSTAPDGLDELPDPSAVFIGGSGSRIKEILQHACRRLKAGGRVVANVVTLENLQTLCSELEANGFAAEVTLINVARSKAILDLTRLEALNPVFIVTGSRREERTIVDE